MQLNTQKRTVTFKVVYYGPPLSGKTTNLLAAHRLLGSQLCGKLMTLDTANDRTLFFDLLPVVAEVSGRQSVVLKLYTVPGQVMHVSTRRLVLAGADGVVFVADSQRTLASQNAESWNGLLAHLRENGVEPERLPTVIQFNKRDLDDVRTDAELAALAKKSAQPIFKATALSGAGVLETLHGVLRLITRDVEARHHLSERLGISLDAALNQIFLGHELR